jgi:peptide/nickel transport system permease protein
MTWPNTMTAYKGENGLVHFAIERGVDMDVEISFADFTSMGTCRLAYQSGKSAADVTILESLHHLVLPALTLSVVGVAQIALHTREKTIDVMEGDYVRFARARGLDTWQIVRHHVLRNVALPAITLQFASIAEIFGGSVLVEQVFSYPGLGQAAVTAALGGDAALLCAIAVVSAALVFAGNAIANLLYGIVDPRIGAGFTGAMGDGR